MRRLSLGLVVFTLIMSASFCWGFYDYRANLGWGSVSGQTFTLPGGGFFTNPAGLGFTKGLSAGLLWTNWWGLKELQQIALSATYRRNSHGIGFHLTNFGDSDLYTETLFNLSYGRQILPRVALGGGIDYLYVSVGEEFGANYTLGFDLGALLKPTEELTIGITGKGLNRMDIGGDKLSPSLLLGIEVSPTSWYRLFVALEKEESKQGYFKTGQDIILKDIVHIRTGLLGEPASFVAGIGIEYRNAEFSITYMNHPDLGGNAVVEINYTIF